MLNNQFVLLVDVQPSKLCSRFSIALSVDFCISNTIFYVLKVEQIFLLLRYEKEVA